MPESVTVEPEVDPVPTEAVTEIGDAPVVEGEPDAAPAPQEEAATEGEAEPPEQAARTYTQAELEEIASLRARELAQYELARERQQRQSENRLRENADRREREEREELLDLVSYSYGRGDEPEQVEKLLQRYTAKREGQMFSRAEAEMDVALSYVTAPLLGHETPPLSPESARLAAKLQAQLQRALDAVVPVLQGQFAGEYIPKADLPKLRKAWLEEQNAKSREGKTELKRPDGVPAAQDNSTIADRLDRIGTPRETPADRQWWNERERARGRG